MKRLPFDKRPRKPRAPKKRSYSSIARPTFEEAAAKAREAGPRRIPKKRNKKRHDAELLRAYGPVERREWIKGLPSVVSGKGPCVNAHTRNGGGSRKADYWWIVPLTKDEHDELHRIGKTTFELKYCVPLDDAAARTEMKWRDISVEVA